MEARGTVAKENSPGVRRTDDGMTTVIEVYQVVCEKWGDAYPAPCHPKDDFWNPIEGFDNVPGAAVEGGALLAAFFEKVPKLRVDRIGAPVFSVGMLTVMKEVMFVQKGLDAGREDADPDFPCRFDESDRAKVVQSDVVRLFGDGSEETPFPGRGTLAVSPQVREVVVELLEKVIWESNHHVVR